MGVMRTVVFRVTLSAGATQIITCTTIVIHAYIATGRDGNMQHLHVRGTCKHVLSKRVSYVLVRQHRTRRCQKHIIIIIMICIMISAMIVIIISSICEASLA